jgi:hypothetical protein
MAETLKLPVIGPTKRTYVYAGGALVLGIVGYAYWTRTRSTGLTEATGDPSEVVPQDREPPPTVVGSESFDDENVRAIINTNPEWYTAAIDYLVSTGGFDFVFASVALGKFLARRTLTESEANLVQAAKGAVGEPPQGGPWPIIRGTATTPGPKSRTVWQGHRLLADVTWYELAKRHAGNPSKPDSVQATKLGMFARNPLITSKIGTHNAARLRKGWIVMIPVHHKVAA